MPCLILNTSQVLEEQQKSNVCLAVSAKTAEILSKPESYVMVLINDQQNMSFAGSTEPSAYIELKSLGLPDNQTAELSRQLCEHIADLINVPQNRIYIEFSSPERHMWGWDGRTF